MSWLNRKGQAQCQQALPPHYPRLPGPDVCPLWLHLGHPQYLLPLLGLDRERCRGPEMDVRGPPPPGRAEQGRSRPKETLVGLGLVEPPFPFYNISTLAPWKIRDFASLKNKIILKYKIHASSRLHAFPRQHPLTCTLFSKSTPTKRRLSSSPWPLWPESHSPF